MSNSNQGKVSVALSVGLLAAVAAMAFPLITEDASAEKKHASAQKAVSSERLAPSLPANQEMQSAPMPPVAIAASQVEPTAASTTTPAAGTVLPQPSPVTETVAPAMPVKMEPVSGGRKPAEVEVTKSAVAAPTKAEKPAAKPSAVKPAQAKPAKEEPKKPSEPVKKPEHNATAETNQWDAIRPEAPAKREKVVPAQQARQEIPVTISGDKAWVQIEPTRTVTVRKGDELPHFGKVLEIRKNEVVTEKGTLTTQ